MTDVKKPKIVNQKYSKKVLDILNKNYLSEFKSFLNKKTIYQKSPSKLYGQRTICRTTFR